MSGALSTQGVKLERGNGATPTEVFAEVGEIVSFRGPGGSARVIDVTHLQSVAKEKRMGLPDEGQFNFDLNLVPDDTGQEGLRDDRLAQARRNFKLTLTDTPTPTVLTFAGFVLEFAISGAVDDKISATATIEIDGPVDWS